MPAGEDGLVALGALIHHAGVGRVDAEGDGRRAVGDEVDPQHLDRRERHRQTDEARRRGSCAMAPRCRRQLEPHELDGCCRRWCGPRSTAPTIVAKLSSASTMSAASLVTSVPVMPMATPMSALLQRRARRSRRRRSSPPRGRRPCSALTIRTLCSGDDAGAHADVVDARGQLRVVQPVELVAGRRPAPAMPSSRGDGAGGGGVVAGDHLHLDAGLVARGDGVRASAPGRVDDADQARRA